MERFELRPRGPYALAASVRFLEGFAPAAYESATPGHLHLAFVADGGAAVAGVCVRDEGGVVVGEIVGDVDPGVVRVQVARILSLDVDGSGFPAVGARDPVIGRLQAHYPGLRPVLFYSPYEAAAWTLIGQRIRITQAARIKARMAEELGPAVTVHGERLHVFPGPARLADLDAFPGLTIQNESTRDSSSPAATSPRFDPIGKKDTQQFLLLRSLLSTVGGAGYVAPRLRAGHGGRDDQSLRPGARRAARQCTARFLWSPSPGACLPRSRFPRRSTWRAYCPKRPYDDEHNRARIRPSACP